ncbi:MAG: cupredoxin domain-containing protein [Actinomycetota bacterium]
MAGIKERKRTTEARREDLAAQLEGTRTGSGWTGLAAFASWGMVLSFATFLIVEGFIPPLVAIGVVFVVGLLLLGTTVKAGFIVLLVGFLAAAALTGPFLFYGLLNIQAPFEFVPTLMMDLSIIAGIIATIAALRKKEPGSSVAARVLGITGIAILLAGATASALARVALEEGQLQPGDVAMLTRNFEFLPEEPAAEAGKVTVYFTNSDRATHSFTIDELGVDLFRPGGTSGRVTFNAQPGRYPFHCEPHPDMKGVLVVK